MVYHQAIDTIRLSFAEGFRYYGADTALTVTATVNLPVPEITHRPSGTVLTDGQVLDGETWDSFDIPNSRQGGWFTTTGSHVSGWTYDLIITIAGTDRPTILWTATVAPTNAVETITPGMGATTGGTGGLLADGTLPAAAKEDLAADFGNRSTTIGAALVPSPTGPLGNRWVFLGDSITAGSNDHANLVYGDSYPLWVQLHSKGRIHMARNAGLSGDTTAGMVARFDTEVAPHAPTVVFFMGGTNDIGTNLSFAEFQSNVDTIRRKCSTIGASLVLSTITPRNGTADVRSKVTLWNAWIRRYASLHGLHLFDAYAAMVDPLTGDLRAGEHSDGLHPNSVGRRVLGMAVADALMPYVRQWSPTLLRDEADSTASAFTSNRLLATDSNTDGIPDGWAGAGGNAGTFSHSLTTDPNVPGKMMTITMTGGSSGRSLLRSLPAGSWAVGDRIYYAGVVTSDGGVQVNCRVQVTLAGGTFYRPTAAQFTGAVERGVFAQEFTIPPNATDVQLTLYTYIGNGTASMGQPTIMNLTKLGLV